MDVKIYDRPEYNVGTTVGLGEGRALIRRRYPRTAVVEDLSTGVCFYCPVTCLVLPTPVRGDTDEL